MADLDILNDILAGEHLGIAAYDAALGTGLLAGPTADAARAFQADHKRHRELLTEQIVARGLAVLDAGIGGVEAQHWAVLLGATGANPVPSPIIDASASPSQAA